MGFLAPAEAAVARGFAAALRPPPPPDITRWCEENVIFDERSPFPGPFDITRFPFLRGVHEVLSPEHPAREVTVKGSAQWGKTVSVVNPTLGAWFEYGPLDALVVHPTMSAAADWTRTKWLPLRRQAPSLRRIFGDGRGEQTDTTQNQETLARDGSLKVASAGSPADLTGTTRRLVIMDDVAKYEMSDKGDPESLAESRASAFEDAKILRVSTSLIKGTCRIGKAFARSDQRLYHVPCPHCGNMAPLTWENFKASIDPERLHAAHFTCEACGAAIHHGHKEAMVSAGRWVATNPAGDHPGFFLWRAYAPQRDWASIAVEYARVMGWSTLAAGEAREADTEPEAETEQTFFNDVLGLEYEQASGGQDWTRLRDRVEKSEEGAYLARGRVPARGVMLTGGVDCQGDRIELQIVAWGRDRRSWVIDHVVIPHHIGEEAGRDALDAHLRAKWRTTAGLELGLDALAIDSSAYTDDVWTWVKRYPRHRVIAIKGSSSQNGPIMMPMQERRRDGKPNKARTKQGFMLNVSQMKADFYARLEREDPDARGFVAFATGLGDEFYRQITAEVRVLRRQRSGVVTSQWELVEATRRNEALDAHLYAEAAARRAGWAAMTELQWDALDAERGVAPPEAQRELFDMLAPTVAPVAPPAAEERRQRVRMMP
ncbi:phage terminase large subunit family protein [Amaricoccus solimangrovi]|uniref:Terminase n=1 Tax=Amaricoccus solimangrovi TaxID=2589815 RepID=A0A501WJB9_9RHOB|nr:terminase gpA endonuclease subunit [Amaricoccus solimangrovi]TPE47237.1 terminase [Amaricoccus solimangrovi]